MNSKIFVIVIVCVAVVAAGIYFLNRTDNTASLAPPQAANPEPAAVPQAQTPPASTPTPAPSPTPALHNPPCCKVDSGHSTTPAPSGTNTVVQSLAPASHTVTIQNFAFSASSLKIKKGDMIVWTNNDSAPHTVTGDNGGPSSPTLNNGGTYRFTFNSAGTFPYHCAFHPSMIASVVVTD